MYKKIERKNQKIKNLAQTFYKELLAWCFKKDRIEKDPIVAEKLNTNCASPGGQLVTTEDAGF